MQQIFMIICLIIFLFTYYLELLHDLCNSSKKSFPIQEKGGAQEETYYVKKKTGEQGEKDVRMLIIVEAE